jgi:hypothetical protein
MLLPRGATVANADEDYMPINSRQVSVLAAVFAATCWLVGCGAISDETAAALMTDPGRYDAYPCPNLFNEMNNVNKRMVELEQLMAVAGVVASALAYRNEYLVFKARKVELAKAMERKQCNVGNPYSSRRSLY